MTRRTASGVLAWLLAVAVATGVGVAAVSVIGSGIVGSGPQPLSAAEVNAQLSSLPTVPPTTSTTPLSRPEPTTSAAAESKVFSVPGGTIIARCAPGGVEIVSATPAQGFHVSGDIEIDDHPKVRFRSGREDHEVRFRCVSGLPAVESR